MENLDLIENSYKKLINDSIKNLNNETETVKIFVNFLESKDLIQLNADDSIHFKSKQVIFEESELSDFSYELLHNKIIEYIDSLINNNVENPGKHAYYIANYLNIIYYRAFIKESVKSYTDYHFIDGMSANEAYDYIHGRNRFETKSLLSAKGILESFEELCVKYQLPKWYMEYQQKNLSLLSLFNNFKNDEDNFEKFLGNYSTSQFNQLYTNFNNFNICIDYRCCCKIMLDLMNELKNDPLLDKKRKSFESIQLDLKEDSNMSAYDYYLYLKEHDDIMKEYLNISLHNDKLDLINQSDELENYINSDGPLNFFDFINDEFLMKYYKFYQTINSEIIFDNFKYSNMKKITSLTFDISHFIPLDMNIMLISNKNIKDIDKTIKDENIILYNALKGLYKYTIKNLQSLMPDKEKNFNDFKNLIELEAKCRQEKLLKQLLQDSANMDSSEKEKMVVNFLKNGDNTSYHYQNQYQLNNRNFKIVCDNLKKDEKSFNIIASYQKRFEQQVNYGIDDYTYLVCGPIKIMERILKSYTQKYYSDSAYIIKDYISTGIPLEIKNGYYDTEFGGIVLTLQNAIDTKGNEMPWLIKGFLRKPRSNKYYTITSKCPLYDEFVKHVRNGYFHTDVIDSLDNGRNSGINVYNKVSYWFFQCMMAFNPF